MCPLGRFLLQALFVFNGSVFGSLLLDCLVLLLDFLALVHVQHVVLPAKHATATLPAQAYLRTGGRRPEAEAGGRRPEADGQRSKAEGRSPKLEANFPT